MDRFAGNQKLPFSKKRLPKRVIFSYVLDYLIIIVLIGAFYAIDKIEPYHQQFSLKNYTLHYTYAVKERVPVPLLIVLVVGFPAAVIAVYTLVIDGLFSHAIPTAPKSGMRRMLTGRYRFKDRLWEFNCGLLGLALAVGAAFTITGALKNAIGKPRPDLIDRCKPLVTEDPGPLLLSNYTICTQEDQYIFRDGFKSFPSGHSSSAFAGLFYLSIYLAAKMHVLDSKGEVWKTFIVMVPTLAAALIAGSRIMDARHHPFDVITGSLLGMLTAWGSYRQYFPPVSETWRKGRAYPIRSWGKDPLAPEQRLVHEDSIPLQPIVKVRDEERRGSGSSTGVAEHQGNVFREQISASQRQRAVNNQSPYNPPAPPGYGVPRREETQSSTYSQQVPPGRNPFLQAPPRHDNYDESSSEDEYDDLSRQYTLSNPQRGAISPYEPNNNLEDTSYPSQTIPPVQATIHTPPGVHRSDGERSSSVPRRPIGEPERQRGVQLTESYA
ncbi:PAP2-domain-containing protein [Pseudovirgaria hyperparasitica]|uniref:PAP2-domain-containing protein n=1 Tax=Pseudovirgaria hyperparasitica TaxID=470096 RepID=A0A6A6VYD5_9PEZI|nr:PAP2-domain-containing protein [Pseudovirgaria hyperparasitica]KAF2755215.1 PAP2-domain-containing protein [Pseudovirgaria hyperparasitica]